MHALSASRLRSLTAPSAKRVWRRQRCVSIRHMRHIRQHTKKKAPSEKRVRRRQRRLLTKLHHATNYTSKLTTHALRKTQWRRQRRREVLNLLALLVQKGLGFTSTKNNRFTRTKIHALTQRARWQPPPKSVTPPPRMHARTALTKLSCLLWRQPQI
jgi:hypothetical protein